MATAVAVAVGSRASCVQRAACNLAARYSNSSSPCDAARALRRSLRLGRAKVGEWKADDRRPARLAAAAAAAMHSGQSSRRVQIGK